MSLMSVSSESAHDFTVSDIRADRSQFGVQRQLGHADDAVERRANFVAHVGQEFALGSIGGFGSFLGLLQLGFTLLARALYRE